MPPVGRIVIPRETLPKYLYTSIDLGPEISGIEEAIAAGVESIILWRRVKREDWPDRRQDEVAVLLRGDEARGVVWSAREKFSNALRSVGHSRDPSRSRLETKVKPGCKRGPVVFCAAYRDPRHNWGPAGSVWPSLLPLLLSAANVLTQKKTRQVGLCGGIENLPDFTDLAAVRVFRVRVIRPECGFEADGTCTWIRPLPVAFKDRSIVTVPRSKSSAVTVTNQVNESPT